VRYLSQHFVERLCSAPGLATELRAELERVVFNATDPTQRMQAQSFSQLRETLLEPIVRARQELRAQILRTSEAIVQESQAIDALPKNKEDRETQAKALENAKKDLAQLLPKDSESRAKRLTLLETAVSEVNALVETLRKQKKSVEDLKLEVKRQHKSATRRRTISSR
jgi:hypothetical protein